MRSRARALHVVVILACVLGGAAAGEARPKVKAPTSVDVELVTVMATHGQPPSRSKAGRTKGFKGVDPRLGKQPALTKPPFSVYDTFKVLRRGSGVLAKGISWRTKLPSGFDLTVGLKQVVVGKKPDQPMQFVLTARVTKPGTNIAEPVVEARAVGGEMIFVPTPTYRGGILVVGIRVITP